MDGFGPGALGCVEFGAIPDCAFEKVPHRYYGGVKSQQITQRNQGGVWRLTSGLPTTRPVTSRFRGFNATGIFRRLSEFIVQN